jgi:WhiB family redox-sensing transcriptional regulator
MDDAACAGYEFPEAFFPGREEGADPTVLAFCKRCPVRAECLQYALDNGEHGVWGGTTDKQRDYQRRHVDRTPMKRRPTRPRPACGTPGGRKSHSYYGEPICDECRAAEAAQKREQRKKATG